jgi:dihydrofolate reductase
MGRKTYDSVPVHLRPLAKRINVIITRDKSGAVAEGVMRELEVRRGKIAAKAAAASGAAGAGGSVGQEDTETKPAKKPEDPITDAIVTRSLDDALTELQKHYGASGRLGKIYVIGGAEIYAAALARPSSSSAASTELSRRPIRVVMTNVARKRTADEAEKETEPSSSFDCDTFFPVDELSAQNGWRSVSTDEVSEWVGEDVSGEWKEDAEVEIQMVGFERV